MLKYFLLDGDVQHDFCWEKLLDPWERKQVQRGKWSLTLETQWFKKKKDLQIIQDWHLRAQHTLDLHLFLKAVVNRYEKLMKLRHETRSHSDSETLDQRTRKSARLSYNSQQPKINS